MVIEIYTFGDFASSDAEKDSATAVAAGCAIGFEGEGGFLRVRGFDENEFEFPDLVENSHTLPHGDDRFHVEVRRKEHHHAIRGNFGEFHEEATVITYNARFITDLKARGDGGLVGATCDNHGQE